MSVNGLSCVVCGRELRNVFEDADNQPSEGLAFSSAGHYGSTAYDPMSGELLEINVCDQCLVEAGKKKRVYVARRDMQVTCGGMLVAFARADYRPVHWHQGLASDRKRLEIEVDDLRHRDRFPEIEKWDEAAVNVILAHPEEFE